MIDWLCEQADQTSLMQYVCQPTILDEFPLPKKRVDSYLFSPKYFVSEARRVMWAALLRHSPIGLSAFLPQAASSGIGLFEGGIRNNPRGDSARNLIRYLISGWSGIDELRGEVDLLKDKSPCPEKLWQELSQSELLEDVTQEIEFAGNRELLISHAWCAWCAGEWNDDVHQRFFSPSVTAEYSRSPLKAERFHCYDPRFPAFVDDFNGCISAQLSALTEAGDIDAMLSVMRWHRGDIPVETMLVIAENFTPAHEADNFSNLLKVTHSPNPEEIEGIETRLALVDQNTIKKILPYTGSAMLYVLDSVDDQPFCDLYKAVMGTFAQPLIPDSNYTLSFNSPELAPWYPGRLPCGVTNLQPFYDAFSSSTKKIYQEIISICGKCNSIEGGSIRLKLMAGIDPGKRAAFSSFRDNPEVVALMHRLPSGKKEQLAEKTNRLLSLGKLLLTADHPKRDFIQLWGIGDIREVAQLYAESAGLNSWFESAFEMATLLRTYAPLEIDDYTLTQCPHEIGGFTVHKGKRKLKNLPSTLKNDDRLIGFFSASQLLHLLALALFRDIHDHYIETGNLPSKSETQAHCDLFGLDPLTIMEEKIHLCLPPEDVDSLKNLLSAAIAKVTSSEDSGMLMMRDLPEVSYSQPINLNTLQEHGWPCLYWHKSENYVLDREFKHYGLKFHHTPKNKLKAKSGILPNSPVYLEVKDISLSKDTPLRENGSRTDRIVASIIQELTLSAV